MYGDNTCRAYVNGVDCPSPYQLIDDICYECIISQCLTCVEKIRSDPNLI